MFDLVKSLALVSTDDKFHVSEVVQEPVENPYGDTPLHVYARGDRYKDLTMILRSRLELSKNKEIINRTNNLEETALFIAAKGGKARCVKRLLKIGADFRLTYEGRDRIFKGQTPEEIAKTRMPLSANYERIVKLIKKEKFKNYEECCKARDFLEATSLLRKGVKIDQDKFGNGPMLQALIYAKKEDEKQVNSMIQLLREGKKDNVNCPNNNGQIVLALAINRGFNLIVSDLCKKLKDDESNVDLKIKYKQQTFLHIAARKGNIKALKILLKKREIDVDAGDKIGQTPLHLAVIMARDKGKEFIRGVELLLRECGDLKPVDQRGFTPLNYAVMKKGNDALIDLLMRHHPNFKIADRALYAGNKEVARIIQAFNKNGELTEKDCATLKDQIKNYTFMISKRGLKSIEDIAEAVVTGLAFAANLEGLSAHLMSALMKIAKEVISDCLDKRPET